MYIANVRYMDNMAGKSATNSFYLYDFLGIGIRYEGVQIYFWAVQQICRRLRLVKCYYDGLQPLHCLSTARYELWGAAMRPRVGEGSSLRSSLRLSQK